MAALIVLVILCIPYVVASMIRARHAPTCNPSDTGSQDELAWSALDDRQLTRLLTDSAPPATTE